MSLSAHLPLEQPVGLPIASQVIEVSPESPFLGLRIALDPGQIGELILAAVPSETPGLFQRRLARATAADWWLAAGVDHCSTDASNCRGHTGQRA
jgi:hypothetical protein